MTYAHVTKQKDGCAYDGCGASMLAVFVSLLLLIIGVRLSLKLTGEIRE